MGYTRRKVKTRRRVKWTKTKNTRKQRRLRNRTFRKSRRVNRGGSDPVKSSGMSESKMEDEPVERVEKYKPEQGMMAKIENAQRDAIDNEKDEETESKRLANIKRGAYRTPLGKGRGEVIVVDQRKRLANTKNQQRFMDELDAEEVPGGKEGGPIWFAGKKKRAIKKKRSA
jgi:hypothetical protein